MIKAFFLDFYGTVVHEDGETVKKIVQIIYDTGAAEDKNEIGRFWWNEFQSMFVNSFGEKFETQRTLEQMSLENTVKKFHSTANARELSSYMFEHWIKPPVFEDSKAFFESAALPVYIVSNIDTEDIMKAIAYHNLTPDGVFTSEDARSYKPRKELFELALRSVGLRPEEVIHIGDSISSDVKGASEVGINAVWLNRFGKEAPDNVISIGSLSDALSIEI